MVRVGALLALVWGQVTFAATGTAEAQARASVSGTASTSSGEEEEEEASEEAEAADNAATPVEEAAPSEPPKPLPWRNSIFSLDQALSVNTLLPNETLSANPNYTWFLTLRPRWYLTDTVFVAVQQGLSIEWTDTDARVRNREPVLTDTNVDLIWNNALSLPIGSTAWSFSPGLRVTLPVSIASRAQELYFGLGPSVASRLPLDVMKGLLLGWNARYAHNFQGTNGTTTETTFPCFQLDGAQTRCSSAGGPSSDSDSIITTLFASLSPIDDMTLDMSFTWWWRFGHELATARVPVDSAPNGYITLEDESETKMRLATSFSVGASYNVVHWLNMAFTVNTFSAEFASDGSRRNPFFNVYDTTVDLTATVVLDQFYSAYFGAESGGSTPTNPRNQVKNGDYRRVAAF